VFQGIRDWFERRTALREIRIADTRQSEGFSQYFADQLETARQAFDRADPDQAKRILFRIRSEFPKFASVSNAVLQLLLDLQLFDEAETMVRVGQNKYPGYEVFARGYIAVAHRRGDPQETLQRCEVIRNRFPRLAEGYSVAAACLLTLERFADAEEIVKRGVQMAPDEAELHIQNARNAARRRDWPEALLRWDVVRTRFDDKFLGHLGVAQSLKELGRFDEAEDILVAMHDRFYKVQWGFLEWADLAAARGNLEEAADRWRAVVKRFPTFGLAYMKATEALRRVGQAEEIDELLRLGAERMRSDLAIHLAYAREADHRKDEVASARRWALVLERFPDCTEARENVAHATVSKG
jgi:predicted Zn-dependent protease